MAPQHEQVKNFKLDGVFAKDVFDDTSPTIVPDEKDYLALLRGTRSFRAEQVGT